MLVDKMINAWEGRPEEVDTDEGSERSPRLPAGASPLDEMYLDAATTGGVMMQTAIDGPTLGCTYPTIGTICPTNGCTIT